MLRDILLITIEGWGMSLVASGGGSLCRTPSLDALAGGGVFFDQCWVHSTDPLSVLAAIATAAPSLEVEGVDWSSDDGPFSRLRLEGLHATLVTDSEPAADQLGPLFDEAILLSSSGDGVDPAATLEETQISALFQAAAEAIQQSTISPDEPRLVWLHCRGLSAAWDAPYELRTILCDEDDPPPSETTMPPRVRIDSDTDPDIAFDAMCGAAAQGIAIDAAWAMMSRFLDDLKGASQRPSPVVALMGVSGYPLAEHAAIGPSEGPLHAEKLHVPLIVLPAALPLGRRYPHAVQPRHVGQMLAAAARESSEAASETAWWQLPPRLAGEWPAGSQLAWAYHEKSLTLISAAWVAVRSDAADGSSTGRRDHGEESTAEPLGCRWELYVNPDDRWQQNDVAARAVEVLDQFKQIAATLEEGLALRPDATGYAALHERLEWMLTEQMVTPDL